MDDLITGNVSPAYNIEIESAEVSLAITKEVVDNTQQMIFDMQFQRTLVLLYKSSGAGLYPTSDEQITILQNHLPGMLQHIDRVGDVALKAIREARNFVLANVRKSKKNRANDCDTTRKGSFHDESVPKGNR